MVAAANRCLLAAASRLDAQNIDNFSLPRGIHTIDQIAHHAGMIGDDAELVADLRLPSAMFQIDKAMFLAQCID